MDKIEKEFDIHKNNLMEVSQRVKEISGGIQQQIPHDQQMGAEVQIMKQELADSSVRRDALLAQLQDLHAKAAKSHDGLQTQVTALSLSVAEVTHVVQNLGFKIPFDTLAFIPSAL